MKKQGYKNERRGDREEWPASCSVVALWLFLASREKLVACVHRSNRHWNDDRNEYSGVVQKTREN